MRFNSKSVLLNDGVNMKLIVDVPEVIGSFQCSDKVWENAIINFNTKLNGRESVTEEVNGLPVDILQMERGEASIRLAIAVKRDDVEAFEDVWFKIKGQLIFKPQSMTDVEAIDIADLIYVNAKGEKVGVLNKS
jgi:hypothetical protein